jgi:hypothetical protein
MSTDAIALMTAIEELFPVEGVPMGILFGGVCAKSVISLELQRTFSGRSWKDFGEEELRSDIDALGFFTKESWVYYLPAYLTVAVQVAGTPHGDVADFLIVYLLNEAERGGGRGLERRMRLLTPAQRQLVSGVMWYVGRKLQYHDSDLTVIDLVIKRSPTD